jgi:putative oxidoreductase
MILTTQIGNKKIRELCVEYGGCGNYLWEGNVIPGEACSLQGDCRIPPRLRRHINFFDGNRQVDHGCVRRLFLVPGRGIWLVHRIHLEFGPCPESGSAMLVCWRPFPSNWGCGRLIKIGIPAPEIMASVTGCFEVTCGSLVILGLLTRRATIPVVVVSVAIWTKLPLLSKGGFWNMAHEARTDYCESLGGLFLLSVGAGLWAFARWLTGKGP